MQRVVRLLKPVEGSFIVGRQRGNVIIKRDHLQTRGELEEDMVAMDVRWRGHGDI